MGKHSTAVAPVVLTPPLSPSNKRKRGVSPAEEIEVDITAPEPPSKKALRKAKKGKDNSTNVPKSSDAPNLDGNGVLSGQESIVEKDAKRSEYGIWIGNLSWNTTKAELRDFFARNLDHGDSNISRLHMPPPSQTTLMSCRQKVKPQNKGFAYVDFTTAEALAEALALSEKLFSGRKVLIKDAKSFEGRPETAKDAAGDATQNGKPPSTRLFVGNLGFDATEDDLKRHFERCGQITIVKMATFEDSGKSKGYAWVEFATLDAAKAAVRGWVDYKPQEIDRDEEDDEEDETVGEAEKVKKKSRPRKWWVNRFGGRSLRMEFAEGKDVRYKKRYGKGGSTQNGEADEGHAQPERGLELIGGEGTGSPSNGDKLRRAPRKVDARTIKPGAALAAAPRLTGSIVESQGKKITFD